jgi:metal-dependent hydrolase (beta-lactamase superfamily II)
LTILLLAGSNEQGENLIEGGMRPLGLDPATIKIIVVLHARGDRYGGVPYLLERYHPRVVMSDANWTMVETRLLDFKCSACATNSRYASSNDDDDDCDDLLTSGLRLWRNEASNYRNARPVDTTSGF